MNGRSLNLRRASARPRTLAARVPPERLDRGIVRSVAAARRSSNTRRGLPRPRSEVGRKTSDRGPSQKDRRSSTLRRRRRMWGGGPNGAGALTGSWDPGPGSSRCRERCRHGSSRLPHPQRDRYSLVGFDSKGLWTRKRMTCGRPLWISAWTARLPGITLVSMVWRVLVLVVLGLQSCRTSKRSRSSSVTRRP